MSLNCILLVTVYFQSSTYESRTTLSKGQSQYLILKSELIDPHVLPFVPFFVTDVDLLQNSYIIVCPQAPYREEVQVAI